MGPVIVVVGCRAFYAACVSTRITYKVVSLQIQCTGIFYTPRGVANYLSGANPMKCFSFFKVGGGFRMEDYNNIYHHTDGKWIDFDPKNPPLEYIELGGKDWAQYERPDVWIKPSDSLVVEVKAASVSASDQFRMGYTLRFPRFKRLRMDKDWTQALNVTEFRELKARAEEEAKQAKDFKLETRRKITKKPKTEITIAGNEVVTTPYAGPVTQIFTNLNFCILSEALQPHKKSKAELEQLVKANGGSIFQSAAAKSDMICVADKKVVKVASLMKTGKRNVIRSKWVFDNLSQAEVDIGKPNYLLPFEPEHMFFLTPSDEKEITGHVDRFGDSYARDVREDELKLILDGMTIEREDSSGTERLLDQLNGQVHDITELKGFMFRKTRIYLDFEGSENRDPPGTLMDDSLLPMKLAENVIRFGAGTIVDSIEDEGLTHIVVVAESRKLGELRKKVSERRGRIPRIVKVDWVEESWKEGTLLDEEPWVPGKSGKL
jgi:DNA ligase-4